MSPQLPVEPNNGTADTAASHLIAWNYESSQGSDTMRAVTARPNALLPPVPGTRRPPTPKSPPLWEVAFPATRTKSTRQRSELKDARTQSSTRTYPRRPRSYSVSSGGVAQESRIARNLSRGSLCDTCMDIGHIVCFKSPAPLRRAWHCIESSLES